MRFVNTALSPRPASLPFIPLSPSIPSATAASFASISNKLSLPPTTTKASPNASISVLEFLEVCAKTSKYPFKSSMPNPKALMESVTKSDVLPSSIFPADDNFNIGINAA